MDKSIFEPLLQQFAALLNDSAGDDVKKNAQQWLAGRLRELDLVTREEFDLQVKLLARANQKIDQLEAAIKNLEA
jgi:ubiquinone biosynthesis accessory factor UbiK